MKFYTIEVDEKVWNFLKKNAEPFKDTPNSVLNRIIFGGSNLSASKTRTPPRPFQKQNPDIEPQIQKDLTIDGIKLELETHRDERTKTNDFSIRQEQRSQFSSINGLHLELEDEFESARRTGSSSISSSQKLKPDKDIDDFINELEKSNASVSIKDDFSNILKEIPSDDGEWTEISITPKQVIKGGTQPPTLESAFKETNKIEKLRFEKSFEKPPEKKKPKLISFEDRLYYSMGERLKNQWGEFRQEGVGLLIFANKTVLCKFSKYNEKNGRWLWGVSQADRYAWGPQNWLALILENEDQQTYSFLLFNSQESGVLFDQCKQTTGDKYITMLIDDAYNSLRIQEWRHLDLRNRKKALPLYKSEDE